MEYKNARPTKERGYIYFAQLELGKFGKGESPIKVGYSQYPLTRVHVIAKHTPFPLKVLAVIHGTLSKEAEIHKALESYRFSGEWYHPRRAVKTYLRNLAAGKSLASYTHTRF